MEKLLKQLSLEKYWPIFDKQNIGYDDFLKLTEQDLKNIGIKLVYFVNNIYSNITKFGAKFFVGANIRRRLFNGAAQFLHRPF